MQICKLRCKRCKKILGIVELNPDNDPVLKMEKCEDKPVDTISKYYNKLARNVNCIFIFCSQECCDKYKEENKNG